MLENGTMRHSWLVSLPLFLATMMVMASEAKLKMAAADQPAGGAEGRPQPADQADSDKTDADQPRRTKSAARPTSMDIISTPAGRKTLTIHFRWSLFPKASVEVRLVPDDPQPKKARVVGRVQAGTSVELRASEPAKGATVTPIYFSDQLKGEVREASECLSRPAGRQDL